MFESFDLKPERFPTPHQIAVFAFWGVLLAMGGCAGFLIAMGFSEIRFLIVGLAAVFLIGVLALVLALLMFILLGVRDWIDYFRE